MTLSNLRRLWSFWRFCFAELFGELKSKVAPSILRSLGDGVTLGTPRDLFARLAGRLNRVVNFTVNSNAIRICMHMCHMSAVIIEKNIKQILWKCPDFDRSHEATPTIQLLTITYVRTLPAAQNTEKKQSQTWKGKIDGNIDDQTPQFLNDPTMSKHVGVRKMM